MTTIQPRTSVVTIYGGDYLDRIRHLERKAEAAAEAEGDTVRVLSEVPESHRLAEEHDALVKEAEEQALHVRLQALKRSEWKRLVAAHPPRDGNKDDANVGVNEETFKDALVAYRNPDHPERRTIVEPDLTEDELDDLSDVDFDRLYLTAFALNRSPAAGPKANLVSRMTQPKDETSN